MPQLGETVTEGTILRWLVKVGDEVKEDDPILEISTDKVDTEVPSPFNGTVTSLLVEEGETVEVGASLLELDGSEKESNNDKSETVEEVQETVEEIVKEDTPKEDVLPKTDNVRNTKNLKLSPVVRRLASENNIDLNGWVAGCDICQDVCPWNKSVPLNNTVENTPKEWIKNLSMNALSWDDKTWMENLKGTTLKRIKPWMWRRNIKANLRNHKIKI